MRNKPVVSYVDPKNPRLTIAIQQLQEFIQEKLSSEDVDIESLAKAVAKAIREGELTVLNRLLEGEIQGRTLQLNQTGDNRYALYAIKQDKAGDSFATAYFYGDMNNKPVVDIVNEGNGQGIRITAENGAVEPAIEIVGGGGGANLIEGGGGYLTSGGVWTDASSKHLKKDLVPVVGSNVLPRVEELPLWSYTYITGRRRHIGPMSEDFFEAFGYGDDKSISGRDLAGIALACVQELAAENRRLTQRVKLLEEQSRDGR